MALSDSEVLFFLKFSERRWLEQIRDGIISFSCAGAFIEQAETSGNNEQGDKHEAVFARLHKSNPKRFEMKIKLGKDLEEIDDGEFVFLRRESAKHIPIFCVYAFTVGEANQNANSCGAGRHNVHHQPDDRMYSGFALYSIRNALDMRYRPSFLLIRAQTLLTNVRKASIGKGLCVKNHVMEYIDMTGEFFIEPTADYPELFVKSKEYDYQLEYRWCIMDKRLLSNPKRHPLNIGPFINDNEVYMFDAGNGYEFGLSLEFDTNSKVISI